MSSRERPLKEAVLYEQLQEGSVRCNLCGRGCTIPEGATGFCRVRRNIGGKLYSVVYSRLCSASIDPIEKKPLYHFYPGSAVFSVATVGCNFRCAYCQNWVISQEERISGQYVDPKDAVKTAKDNECDGISYTYTEPTIFFEFAYDTSKIAHENGLFNTFVTNGYMSPEAVRMIAPFLDAATVDWKGSGDPEFYRKFAAVPSVEPIYKCLLEMKGANIHIEITDLIVPTHGDSMDRLRELASWICRNLGVDTPLHLLRFHPDYKLTDVPATPTKTLEQAREVALREGLRYVYTGNIPGNKGENTYCHNCQTTVVQRYGFQVLRWNLRPDNTCPKCGVKMPIVGTYQRRGQPFPMSIL